MRNVISSPRARAYDEISHRLRRDSVSPPTLGTEVGASVSRLDDFFTNDVLMLLNGISTATVRITDTMMMASISLMFICGKNAHIIDEYYDETVDCEAWVLMACGCLLKDIKGRIILCSGIFCSIFSVKEKGRKNLKWNNLTTDNGIISQIKIYIGNLLFQFVKIILNDFQHYYTSVGTYIFLNIPKRYLLLIVILIKTKI